MDAFLAKVGSKFDSSFIKLHVGTDDLDELVEFTWERSDLSPLVDAGLKPLLRNKLYRAILEERAARSTCVGAAVDASSHSSTGMPSSASLHDDNSEVPSSEVRDDASSLSQVGEAPSLQVASAADACTSVDPGNDSSVSVHDDKSEVPLAEFQDDGSSLSQVDEAPTLQVASVADACTSVDPGHDSSATPRSSRTSAPASSFEGFCTICGEYGHRISECKADSSKDSAHFPALGVAGTRKVVPQAQVSVNQPDERERRQVARKAAAEAEERAEKDRWKKAAEAQARVVRERQIQCHYCLGKGHRLRDCPKKTADMQESARQRAQEAQDQAEREKRRREEARQRQEDARQRQEASQGTGYGRQFGRSGNQSSYASGGYGRQFGMSSAYQSSYGSGPLYGCPRSCRICYPSG